MGFDDKRKIEYYTNGQSEGMVHKFINHHSYPNTNNQIENRHSLKYLV